MQKHKWKYFKTPSIRTQLIAVFTIFTALALGCLLIFQTVFLDDLYEWIKAHQIRTAARDIAASVDDEETISNIAYWSAKEQCSVYVIDENGNTLYRDLVSGVETEILQVANLQQLYRAAMDNDGEYATSFDVSLSVPNRNNPDYARDSYIPSRKPDRQPVIPQITPTDEEITTDVVYVTITPTAENITPSAVVVTSKLTPVTAATQTLLVQFVIAAFVLILFAALLGFVVAHAVARPIVEVNRAAKTLAGGEYEMPSSGGYREIVELKQTLAKTAVELQKTDQLQQELIANLSHDLRTPLTMITGYSEAIRDLPGEQTAENIDVVIDEAQRLSRLVEDVLDLSRLRAGTQTLSPSVLNLADAVSDVVERVRRMTVIHGYTVDFVGDEALSVSADAIRLEQVVYNLLINALAHTGDDRRVWVRCERDGAFARVSFTDNGVGIPPEEQEHIWKRYYRVRKDDPLRESMNSGLGLSIVQTIVELHGGRYGVKSADGQGSTFWFALPLE